jgi:hypothetical protein
LAQVALLAQITGLAAMALIQLLIQLLLRAVGVEVFITLITQALADLVVVVGITVMQTLGILAALAQQVKVTPGEVQLALRILAGIQVVVAVAQEH